MGTKLKVRYYLNGERVEWEEAVNFWNSEEEGELIVQKEEE